MASQHAVTRATTANRRIGRTAPLLPLGAARTPRGRRIRPCDCSGAHRVSRFPQTVSESQVESLLAAPDASNALGLRDRAMFELLYATGLRVSELVGLKLGELSLSEGLVRVVGKGSKERIVPLGEEARAWIERYLKRARPELLAGRVSDAVFVTQRSGAMTRQMFWILVKRYARAPAYMLRCRHTGCATRSRPIC